MYSYPWFIAHTDTYKPGEQIPAGAAGTLAQVIARIQIMADTKEQLIDRLNIVNNLYQVIDNNGNNIILPPHDTEQLYKGLDYEL